MMTTQQYINQKSTMEFAQLLEDEWAVQSEALAEKHLDAAIEAKLAELDNIDDTDKNGVVVHDSDNCNFSLPTDSIHHTTISNKSTCYSPYVPSNAQRIQAMIDFVQFDPNQDNFCDLGCGDGRVCFVVAAAAAAAASAMLQRQYPENNKEKVIRREFRAIGIDVSTDCISMAKQHLSNDTYLPNIAKKSIAFYQADLTIDPSELLSDTSQLHNDLLSATVIYLYTFPTLLVHLIPLLSQLFAIGRVRAVVTLTYHIHDLPRNNDDNQTKWTYKLDCVNDEHDLCLYTYISLQ